MLFSTIEKEIRQLSVVNICDERKRGLQSLVDFIQDKVNQNSIINLNFICTHNSRRSHLSQIWAQTMANYFKIDNVFCYSGGTAVTALFTSVAVTLKSSGFKIEKLTSEKNPIYAIKYSDSAHPIVGFSKTYDAKFNPSSKFAAILTCSSADKNCPFISGAEQRIPITYEDPKAYDNTSMETIKYKERSLQIATELKYVFSKIASKK